MSLSEAARNNDFILVKAILKENPNQINECDFYGSTSLHHAVVNKNIRIVQLLLENNANVNIRNMNGYTSLHYSCTFDINITRLLLQFGAEINCQTTHDKWTPLYRACVYGCTNQIELLLDNGADPNIKTNYNEFIFDIKNVKSKEFLSFYFFRQTLLELWELE